MQAQIFISDKVGLPKREVQEFVRFVQAMANRLGVGHCRYGEAQTGKKYAKRAVAEMRAYQKTGNREHLVNGALYHALESMAPSNPKFHDDPYVASVTRGRKEFGSYGE